MTGTGMYRIASGICRAKGAVRPFAHADFGSLLTMTRLSEAFRRR